MILYVNTDGGARGNPGPAAVGVVIFERENDLSAEILRKKFGKKIGVATNNVAEYTAVIEGMNCLQEILSNSAVRVEKIVFRLDSQLVASQLSGVFKIKNEQLAELFLKAKQKESSLSVKVFYTYVPREQNKLADFEVNKALDEVNS